MKSGSVRRVLILLPESDINLCRSMLMLNSDYILVNSQPNRTKASAFWLE